MRLLNLVLIFGEERNNMFYLGVRWYLHVRHFRMMALRYQTQAVHTTSSLASTNDRLSRLRYKPGVE